MKILRIAALVAALLWVLVSIKCELDRGSHLNGWMHGVKAAARSFMQREGRLPKHLMELTAEDFGSDSSRDFALEIARESRVTVLFEEREGKDYAIVRGILHQRTFERRYLIP